MEKKKLITPTKFIYRILAVILVFPLAFITFQYIPNPSWPLNLDRLLILAVIIGLVELIYHKIRVVIPILLGVTLIVLTMGTLTNTYSFRRAYTDFKESAYGALYEPEATDTPKHLKPFPHKNKYIEAVDYYNANIRNYAVSLTKSDDLRDCIVKYHEYRRLIQCFAVFRDINTRWNYVNDPLGEEYLVPASENLDSFSGDCDDHSIMMAACIMSIGGTMRLVHTEGHIYPEILIGDQKNLEDVNFIIKQELFKNESKGKKLHYHIDNQKQIWLNLDYTAHYPGGEFLEKDIVSILNL